MPSFLSPLFLVGAIAAAVPILLHLFHRKTEVVIDFPAVSLLKRVPVQQHRRRQLRELILLALRVVALVLLALSFARPYFPGAAAPASLPVTVIAVDTSLSLTAPGQFDRVRDAVARAVSAVPASHAISLISFSDAATVVVAPTSDRAAATSSVEALAPGAGGTRFRTALARASEVIGTRAGRVVIVTDLQQSGWDANDDGGLPDGVDVEVLAIAPPAGNLAVTSAERRDRRIAASVQNYGTLEVKTPVRLLIAGQELARVDVTIAPLGAADVELAAPLPASGTAEVRVDDPAGYQADNGRAVALDPAPSARVGIVVTDPTGAIGGLYLERALAVAASGREFDIDVRDGREAGNWTRAEVSQMAAMFVLGTRSLERGGRDLIRTYLNEGGQVLLAAGPDVDLGTLGEVVGTRVAFDADPVRMPGATLIASDARHPIFRPFLSPSGALGDVQVEQHRRLTDQDGRVVLARFTGGDAALTEQAVGKGRLLIFTSDLDNQWSRFPLSPSFVPFAVETARYLASGSLDPGGAADRTSAGESNPAATSVAEFTNAIERTSRTAEQGHAIEARELEKQQNWWQVGVVMMLIALAVEALVGRRAT